MYSLLWVDGEKIWKKLVAGSAVFVSSLQVIVQRDYFMYLVCFSYHFSKLNVIQIK